MYTVGCHWLSWFRPTCEVSRSTDRVGFWKNKVGAPLTFQCIVAVMFHGLLNGGFNRAVNPSDITHIILIVTTFFMLFIISIFYFKISPLSPVREVSWISCVRYNVSLTPKEMLLFYGF